MNRRNQSDILLIIQNVLAGLFPVLTVFAYQNFLSPFYTLALSSLIAAIFFGILMTIKGERGDSLKNRSAIRDILLAVFIMAIGHNGLYFLALEYTSAANVAILSLMEIFFSYIVIGLLFKKEPISGKHFSGAFLMVLGALLILFRNRTDFNIGDLMMLLSALIVPIGSFFGKRALHQVPLNYLMFCRSIISGIIFYVVAVNLEGNLTFEVMYSSIRYLLFSGIVYLGIMKIMLLFAFKHTSVTHSLAFNALKPLFAFLFAWLILYEAPTANQIYAVIPTILGLYFILTAKLKPTNYKTLEDRLLIED